MAIEDSDLIRLDERYVTRKECNATVDAIKDDISKDRQDVVLMKSDIEAIKRILWWVAGGIGALLLASLGRLIIK